MRLRALAKRAIFGSAPFFRGRFPYYGHIVFFPLGCRIFTSACAEGVYERDTIDLILSLVQPGTTYFDVGANIGLLSVPVLATRPTVNVVSIEASPEVWRYLLRTHSASGVGNWKLVNVAIGAKSGETEFWTAGAANSAFDGLRDTGRGGSKHRLRVPMRTLDDIWRECDRPTVSVVKMDIEGGEYLALKGAQDLISAERPTFVIEWFEQNLIPYGVNSEKLLQFCADIDYSLYTIPQLTFIEGSAMLRFAMTRTWTFALVPKPARGGRL